LQFLRLKGLNDLRSIESAKNKALGKVNRDHVDHLDGDLAVTLSRLFLIDQALQVLERRLPKVFQRETELDRAVITTMHLM